VRLLVVDVGASGAWSITEEDQRVTRLGEGLAAAGVLAAAPWARTLDVVAAFVERTQQLGVERIRMVATSAVREASNGRAFVSAVERVTGTPLDVVTGEAEARLTLRGVRRGLGDPPGGLVVFDIGGGSTEYILADSSRVLGVASLRVGVVELAEREPFPGVVDWDRYFALRETIRARLEAELPVAMREVSGACLVGTAGTVTTLAALDLGLSRYDAARVQGHRLDRGAIDAQRRRLGALTVGERAALPCLEPGRADLILPGVAIVEATCDSLGADALLVSDWGLREGVLVDLLEGLGARRLI